MARKVTKSIVKSTVYGLNPSAPFDTDENGFPIANVTLLVQGNPSQNQAYLKLAKFCGSKNVMVIDIVADETKISIDPFTFYAHSKACIEGISYGREYITQTFKITEYDVLYMSSEGMKYGSGFYIGETTQSKLLNYARESHPNCIITQTRVIDERRFMTRNEYLELASK